MLILESQNLENWILFNFSNFMNVRDLRSAWPFLSENVSDSNFIGSYVLIKRGSRIT